MGESNFEELHLEFGDLKLITKKRGAPNPSGGFTPAPAEPLKFRTIAEPISTAKLQSSPGETSPPAKEESRIDLGARDDPGKGDYIPIKSPTLGTFYRAPKPGEPPFVDVGTAVTKNTTVCLIEVMKLFSSIKAGVSGRIAKICAENGQLVQYKQTLFLIEPEKKV